MIENIKNCVAISLLISVSACSFIIISPAKTDAGEEKQDSAVNNDDAGLVVGDGGKVNTSSYPPHFQ